MSKTIRIMGTSIDIKRPIKIGLRYIYGIGKYRAEQLYKELGWQEGIRFKYITPAQRAELIEKLEQKKQTWLLETDLRRNIEKNITKHMILGTYQGLRHQLHLPVRGQRTHSNSKTQKKLRRTSHY